MLISCFDCYEIFSTRLFPVQPYNYSESVVVWREASCFIACYRTKEG